MSPFSVPPNTISVDERRWPLLLVTLRGTPSDADFAAYLAHFDALLRRNQPYALVLDARDAASPSGYQRHLQAQWLKTNYPTIKTLGRGAAFVFSSPFLRVALSSLLLFQTLPVPYTVCATLDEGIAWAHARLLGT